MKKFFVLFLLNIFCFLTFAEGVVVKTTISLGRKSQGCDGFGICSTQVVTENQPGAVNGTIELNEAESVMVLCLNAGDVKNVQPDKVVYLANKTSVEFAEDYMLPAAVRSALKASKPLVIRRGSYRLTSKGGKYYIEIPL